ncbi:MAG: 2-oxoglutarate dehydrogenase E1 subunit family protein, partial [Pseudonocardia sp.]
MPPFPTAQFGTNEWLVEEMYQRFLNDPATVDAAWHDFFADYRPAPTGADEGGSGKASHGTSADVAASTNGHPGPRPPATNRSTPPALPQPAPSTATSMPARGGRGREAGREATEERNQIHNKRHPPMSHE